MTAPLWRATGSTGGWLVPEQVAPQAGGLWGVGGLRTRLSGLVKAA